jgi:purine-nucleoside phosphorylase
MYTNIPTHDLPTLIKGIWQSNQIDINIQEDVLKLTKTITDQNYFQFKNVNYIQTEGLAMGAPSSAILSEIYMQFLQNNTIYNILRTHNIKGYFRYIDDILIVYSSTESNIHEVLNKLNQINPKLKFTLQEEINKKNNFLDITIQREQLHLTSIYRKPTTTDSIIPNNSCHPKEPENGSSPLTIQQNELLQVNNHQHARRKGYHTSNTNQ